MSIEEGTTSLVRSRQPPAPRRRRANPSIKREQFTRHNSSSEEALFVSQSSLELPLTSSRKSKSNRLFALALLFTTCLLLFFEATAKDGEISNVGTIGSSIGRRLKIRQSLTTGNAFWRPGKEVEANPVDIDSVDVVRYLTFGGPSTYGRGLDEAKRTSQAYPYLMSSTSTTTNVHVRNLAEPNFDTGGPTISSLCTQTLVERKPLQEEENNLFATEETHNQLHHAPLSSTSAFDAITIEFTPGTKTPEALLRYISSMKLLLRRLRQRYPLATITIVQLWTPLDLVYKDPQTNRIVTFAEWRSATPLKSNERFLRFESTNKFQDALREQQWFFRDVPTYEREHFQDLESAAAFHKGTIYKMPHPRNVSASLETVVDWFNEEEIHVVDNSVEDSHYRYTLSQEGHVQVAAGISKILEFPNISQTGKMLYDPKFLFPSFQSSWGSGDSCQLWYVTGKDDLPKADQYSKGLKLSELNPGQYALEVTEGGSLKVHNPFHEDRIVYLTYLTTSPRAAANKVYPKTKVSVVEEGQDPIVSGDSIILDPSHPDNTDPSHRIRTTAVGMVPANSNGVLEFLPLEAYTVYNFRILGVSFLPNVMNLEKVGMEFSISPRRFSPQEDDDK